MGYSRDNRVALYEHIYIILKILLLLIPLFSFFLFISSSKRQKFARSSGIIPLDTLSVIQAIFEGIFVFND